MLVIAIVLITLALLFYTIGVWAERLAGELKWWHVAVFACGLAADASGTFAMSQIANTAGPSGLEGSPMLAQLMAVTGAIALILMLLHVVWAVVVMARGRASEKMAFHKFSLLVWAIWLVPYVTGAAAAMM